MTTLSLCLSVCHMPDRQREREIGRHVVLASGRAGERSIELSTRQLPATQETQASRQTSAHHRDEGMTGRHTDVTLTSDVTRHLHTDTYTDWPGHSRHGQAPTRPADMLYVHSPLRQTDRERDRRSNPHQ